MEAGYPQVGVGALIVDDAGRVLLMLRNKAPEVNHWSIAGGRVEFMEPLERNQGLLYEIRFGIIGKLGCRRRPTGACS